MVAEDVARRHEKSRLKELHCEGKVNFTLPELIFSTCKESHMLTYLSLKMSKGDLPEICKIIRRNKQIHLSNHQARVHLFQQSMYFMLSIKIILHLVNIAYVFVGSVS